MWLYGEQTLWYGAQSRIANRLSFCPDRMSGTSGLHTSLKPPIALKY